MLFQASVTQAWGEYWTKVLEYKYLKKWVQVQVLDFQKYLSTSTLKSTWVQVQEYFRCKNNHIHLLNK